MAAKASFPLALTAFAVAGTVSLPPMASAGGILVGDGFSYNPGTSTVDANSIFIGASGSAANASVAVGYGSSANTTSAALGYQAAADKSGIAIGYGTDNTEGYGFAGGYQAIAKKNGVAVGYQATSASNGVAIGSGAQAGTNDVVIGSNSATHALSNANTMYFSGSPAAGINYSTGARFAVGSVGNERQIQNVAPGVISGSSTDAINGSQLYGAVVGINNVGSSTASLLGGTTAYNGSTGSLSGFAVTIAGTTYTSVTSAIQAAATVPNYGWNLKSNGDTATAVASGDTLTVNSGSSGNLAISRNRNTLTFDLAPNVTATSLTTGNTSLATNGLTIANGPSVLATGIDAGGNAVSHVAAGSLSATSTDATNGAQLYATNQAVAAAAATAAKGIKVQANGDTATQVAPGGTVQFKDGTNVKVTRNGTDVTISTSDTLTATSLTTGNATLTTNGLAIANGPSVLATGIDAGGKAVTNLAAGSLSATSTDATNGAQLYATNQAVAAVTATAAKGFNLQANGDTATQVAPGGTVQLLDGTNVKVTRNGSNVTVSTANDLTATSLTTGNAVMNTGGFSLSGGPSVTTTGIYAGNKVVTGVANGAVGVTSSDAVNGAQLYAVNQTAAAAAATAAQGFNLQANGDTATQVAPGGTVQFKNGQNIKITRNGGDVTVSTADDLTATSLTTGNAVMNTGGFSITGGPSILATGIFAANKTVTGVAAGSLSATSTDATNGAQLYATNQAVAAVTATAAKGFNLQANGDTATQVAPGGTVQFKDGTNIKVTRNGGDVTVSTSDTLTATSVTTGNATLTTNGLTIANGPSVTASGIDAGGKAVTNIATGTLSSTSTDAVTGAQLYATNQTVAGLVTTVTNSAGVVQRGSTPNTIVLTAAGGTPGNPGAAQTLTNVAAGSLSATSTDAVNGSQLYATNTNVGQLRDAVDGLTKSDALSLKYVAGSNGKATNTVVLTGDGSGAAVRVTNVAAGTADGDAVNYGQVKNLVSYDTDGNGNRTGSITLAGPNGAPVRIGNLADGVNGGDAATVRQLNRVRSDSMAYTDTRIAEVQSANQSAFNALSSNIRDVRNEARAGIASAMAMTNSAMPSASGRLTYAVNAATYQGAAAVGGSFAYRFDTSVPLAFTGSVGGSSGYVGGRVGITGEL